MGPKAHVILILLLAVVLASGCTGKSPQPAGNQTAALPQNPLPSPGFSFGIEYAVPGLASTYAETGVHAAKPTPALLLWGKIQPAPGAPYGWADADRHVKEYQEAGFDSLQLLLTAESGWASRGAKDTRPKPGFEDEYVDFVEAAVERYDRDGRDDMPGLRYPVNEWGVEREFTGFFPGSGQEYVEVLKLAYPAIKEANPQAKVP